MLKGLLYRKIFKEKKDNSHYLDLPAIKFKKVSKFIEIKRPDDITKTNITYSTMEPYVYVNIKYDKERNELVYNVIEPELTKEEREKLNAIKEGLVDLIDIDPSTIKDESKLINYLIPLVRRVMKELRINLSQESFMKIMYYLYRDFVGYNEIDPLLNDPNIEDISCDGVGIPIYIVHRVFGSIRTNVVFKDKESLRKLIVKLAQRSGRYVTYAEPILEASLPDGSRVSATIAEDVATRGPTFTIRKFTEKPFSPIELIELGTGNFEIFAYLWFLVEHRISALIIGGVSSGKTSLLNSLGIFIPPEAKIVSIEDTRELRFVHEHWVPTLSRVGFGIPLATGGKYGEVSLFDLLRESFRQNPDYVIVGEVRGKETYVMFQGMASGHASLSTFHAGSVDALVKRLVSPPIELPPMLIESLDLVITMIRAKERGKSARRIREIVEIIGVDPKTDDVIKNVVFRWDSFNDKYLRVNESKKVKEICEKIGMRYEDALKEIENRKRVLEWLYKVGKRSYEEVAKFTTLYYKDPESVMNMVNKGIMEEKEIQDIVRLIIRKNPVLEKLGFISVVEK